MGHGEHGRAPVMATLLWRAESVGWRGERDELSSQRAGQLQGILKIQLITLLGEGSGEKECRKCFGRGIGRNHQPYS